MKSKLIDILQKVIISLENNTVNYNWKTQESCNCGIVAQAITGKVHDKLRDSYLQKGLAYLGLHKIDRTWTKLVEEYCPITGEPLLEIFKLFYSYGITREDIKHLEYLSDKNILARTDIETKKYTNEKVRKSRIVQKTRVIEGTKTIETENKGFWNVLWNGNTTKKIIDDSKTVTEDVTEYYYDDETVKVEDKTYVYYTNKKNLLKYLKAWVQILKEEVAKESEKIEPSNIKFITIDGIKYGYENKAELKGLIDKFTVEEKYESARVAKTELEKITRMV